MSQWSDLKVDILKVIQNFVEMYPYPASECLVLEAIANCLDAKATRIEVSIYNDEKGRKIFKVVDNGCGMSQREFEENYHALSISSKTKGEGIGFAGVGSKLYLVFLASGDSIITETKSRSFQGSSEITVIGKEPKWAYIDKRTLSNTGTLYEVRLNQEDADSLTQERVVQIIQSYYNAILLGRYGDISISFQGKKVDPWKPALMTESKDPILFRIKSSEFKLYFWETKDDQESRNGLEIVVFGKKIKDRQWFELDYLTKPNFRKKVVGQVLADGLASLLTTNKCDFRLQTNPRLWSSFRQKTYESLGAWLEEIGAMTAKSPTEIDPGLESLCRRLEAEVNRLLRDPLFSNYNPFLKTQRGTTLIQDPRGDTAGSKVEGAQVTEGTLGGLGTGQGVEVIGPDEGTGIVPSTQGEEKGVLTPRRVRHGIAINLKDEAENPKESWLTPEAIVINTGHPVFMKSQILGYAAETQHILRCVFFALLESNPPQTFNETLDKLRSFYMKWSTV
jgi:hypothetical protein